MRVRGTAKCDTRAADGRLHQGVVAGEVYLVVGVSSDSYRVWDRNGEPILYPKSLFEVVDPRLPAGWLFHEEEDGHYRLLPASTSEPGFYEDYYCSDGDLDAQQNARRAVRDVLRQIRDTLGEEDRDLAAKALMAIDAHE